MSHTMSRSSSSVQSSALRAAARSARSVRLSASEMGGRLVGPKSGGPTTIRATALNFRLVILTVQVMTPSLMSSTSPRL